MKEKKTFFVENNSLNKGYQPKKGKTAKTKAEDPELSVLAEYEEMHPGTIKKILELAQKEQEHSHSMDALRMKMQATAKRMGRIFGVLVIAILCYAFLTMVALDHVLYAMIFAAISVMGVMKLCCLSRCKCPACSASCAPTSCPTKPVVTHEKVRSETAVSAAAAAPKAEAVQTSERKHNPRRRYKNKI